MALNFPRRSLLHLWLVLFVILYRTGIALVLMLRTVKKGRFQPDDHWAVRLLDLQPHLVEENRKKRQYDHQCPGGA